MKHEVQAATGRERDGAVNHVNDLERPLEPQEFPESYVRCSSQPNRPNISKAPLGRKLLSITKPRGAEKEENTLSEVKPPPRVSTPGTTVKPLNDSASDSDSKSM